MTLVPIQEATPDEERYSKYLTRLELQRSSVGTYRHLSDELGPSVRSRVGPPG